MPSRLLKAFPPGVPINRLPLDEAIARVEQRLAFRERPALEPVK
jgi:ATP-dependent DNA helicase DinG